MVPTEKKKRVLYSPSKVKSALAAIRDKTMTAHMASIVFKVPRTTLRNKITGKTADTSGKFGPKPELGEAVEEEIVTWISDCAKAGFPVNKQVLLNSVEMHVKREQLNTMFKDHRPGRRWFDSFHQRHPTIRQKQAEYPARANATEAKIRKWFQDVENLLGDDAKILNNPQRVFTTDETAFGLTPKGDLELVPREESVHYDVSKHSDKTNITTLVTVNAEGTFAAPMTVFNYQKTPKAILDNAPEGWSIGNTENGWMTGECFYEYISNPFLKWLKENEIQLPVVMFLDGHRSHLTMHLSRFCRENGIILVALAPNAAHILQPLDEPVFRPIKSKSFREEITENNITVDLNALITHPNMPKAIQSGFRACGIYPFDPNAINYGKCREVESELQHQPSQTHLEYIESKIEIPLMQEFKDTESRGHDWEGDLTARRLFDFWLATKRDDLAKESAATAKLPLARENPDNNMAPSSTCSVQVSIDEVDDMKTPPSTPPLSQTCPFEFVSKPKAVTSLLDVFKDAATKKTTTRKRTTGEVPLTHQQCVVWKELEEKEDKEAKKRAKKLKRKVKREEKEKKKAAKRRKKMVSVSSSSSEDLDEYWPQLESDDSLEGIAPFAESDSETDVDDDAFFEVCDPKEGDYILVEFERNMGNAYYVGKVMNAEEYVVVNFMRKKGTASFYFPIVPNEGWVKKEAVRKLLPLPDVRRGVYKFDVHFPIINIM